MGMNAMKSSRHNHENRKRLWRWSLIGLSAALILGAGSLTIAWSVMSRDAEDFLKFFALRSPKTISKVLDRNGEVLGILAEEHRVLIPYGDIPKAFVSALVATEDVEFWSHSGVSPRGIMRAVWNTLSSFGQRREGASTLTMQLVRTVTNKRQLRLERKLKEIILARRLEDAYTKKQIFEMYANEVWFGGQRYGLEAAAQYFFGKSAPQLKLEECALLVGIIQNPRYQDPYSRDPKTRERVFNRRNHVLNRMVAEGYLKESEAAIYKARPIRTARPNAQADAIAPYAVEEIRKYLVGRYGQDAVQNGGLEIYTTLDSVWQQGANEAVEKGLKAVDRRRGFRKESLQTVSDPESATLSGWNRFLDDGDQVRGIVLGWSGTKAQVRFGKRTLEVPESAFAWAGKGVQSLMPRGTSALFLVKAADSAGLPTKVELDQDPEVEGALLAVDPESCEIRAMVGGYNFKRSFFNRSTQAERQVGSTFKAFVYGAALATGKTSASLIPDVPTRYTFGGNTWEPKNYEFDYWGAVPIWDALCHSRNVSAVRAMEEVGAENVVTFARMCGVQGTIRPYPSTALGAADLTLKDMVRGYATFANGGRQAPPPFIIKKILDRNGKVLEAHEARPGEQVLDPMSNYQLIQCLQGVAQRGTGARSNALDWPVAGKTGTTNDYTDALFLGFSTRVVCGVWVGMDTKKPIYRGADGGKVALPIWVDFMKTALPTTPHEEFPVPEGMEWAEIDKLTGLIATSATDPKDVVRLAFKPGTLPREASTPDAIQAAREFRSRAGSMALEERPWGVFRVVEEPVIVEDPNEMQ